MSLGPMPYIQKASCMKPSSAEHTNDEKGPQKISSQLPASTQKVEVQNIEANIPPVVAGDNDGAKENDAILPDGWEARWNEQYNCYQYIDEDGFFTWNHPQVSTPTHDQ